MIFQGFGKFELIFPTFVFAMSVNSYLGLTHSLNGDSIMRVLTLACVITSFKVTQSETRGFFLCVVHFVEVCSEIDDELFLSRVDCLSVSYFLFSKMK